MAMPRAPVLAKASAIAPPAIPVSISVESGTAGRTMAETVISRPITVHSSSRRTTSATKALAATGRTQTMAVIAAIQV